MSSHTLKIGFIGQGWIGKHYADDFEKRDLTVIRYSKEEAYIHNKEKIALCDIVFIAVPTPTTPEGFDISFVRDVLQLVGKGKSAVIKSTITPGTTEALQKEYPDLFIFHSPEFLTEITAAHDASNPQRNIVGIPVDTQEYRARAQEILSILPFAPFSIITSAKEAELIKYAGNCFLFVKVIYANLLYDLAQKLGCDWQVIRDVVAADPRIGVSHLEPIHKSGRGAGGNCFIKDFAAFTGFYKKYVQDQLGEDVLQSLQTKNIELLKQSNKDLDLLKGVFGPGIIS